MANVLRINNNYNFQIILKYKKDDKLYKSLNGSKQYDGVLQGFKDNTLSLKLESNEEIEINLEEVSSAKILYNWEDLKNE